MTGDWPALVLTAGLGTRLRPLSLVRAKPAVPVAGKPLVCRILRRLADAGIQEAVLNLHYLPHTVTSVVGDGASLGLRVRYSWEDPVLGSAGGPRRALPLLEASRFLIVNGDTLSDCDLRTLVRAHEASGALATLAVIPNPAPHQYGGVVVSEDGVITGFVPRGAPGPTWHFIGLQAVEAEAFARVPADTPYETVNRLYPALMREHPGSIRALRCEASFFDIGTPDDCLRTSRLFAGLHTEESVIGTACDVHTSARVAGSVLWDGVVVERDAVVTRCIVADRVRIPQGARLENAAVIPAEGRDAGPGEQILDGMLVAPLRAAHGATPARTKP